MADEPNQSNKGPVNRLGSGPSWIERQGQAYAQQTAQARLEQQRLSIANERISVYSAAMQAGIPEELRIKLESEIGHETKMVNTLLPRSELRAETRRERFTSLAVGNINREFNSSSVNGQVNDISRTTFGQNRALGYMSRSYNQLEQMQSSHMNQIGSLEKESLELAQGLYDTHGNQDASVASRLKNRQIVKQMLEKEMGGITGAMSMQRSMGLDPMSQNRELLGAGQKAAGMLSSGQLESNQFAKKAAEELTAALEKLKDTVGKTDEEIDTLRSEAKKSAEDFNKASGGGGGGHNNRMIAGLGVAAGALDLAAGFGREVLLNQTNTITGNRITAAAMTNNLFDRRRAALSGDMTQLSMLSSGALNGAQAEGQVNKKSSLFTETTSTGAAIIGGAGAITAGLASAGGMTSLIAGGTGALISAPALAIGAGIGAIGYGVYRGIGALRGAPQNSEKLAEEQRQIQLADQLAHVPGAMRQRLYDYGQGLRGAALEAGGAGDAFLVNSGSSAMLGRLQNARIGTDQFAQMAAQGFGQQGSVFNGDQIFGARNLEHAGMGSMSTNMSRMGTLASGGSNNPQASLQAVMESAFTKSLDSSKALSMMVENTSAIAGTSIGATRAGMDTTGAASRILSNLVNPNMKNEAMAVQRAATASGILNDINTSRGTSFADMAGTTAVARAGGADWMTAVNLRGIDNATRDQIKRDALRIEKLSGTDKTAAQSKLSEQLTTMGLIDFTKNGTVNTQKLLPALNAASGQVYRRMLGGIDPNLPGYSELASGNMSKETLNSNPQYSELHRAISKSAPALLGLTSDESTTRGEGLEPTKAAISKAGGAMAGTGPISDIKKILDDLATVQFAEMSKEAKLAATQLGGVVEALQAMNEASTGLAAKVSAKNSDAVMGASTEAAKSFEIGASTFTTSVERFGSILNSFASSIGVRVPEPTQKK